jgi:hypothetical protein
MPVAGELAECVCDISRAGAVGGAALKALRAAQEQAAVIVDGDAANAGVLEQAIKPVNEIERVAVANEIDDFL